MLERFLHHATTQPDRPALTDGRTSLSYGALAARVLEAAAWAHTLPPTVGLIGGKSIDWVIADLALTLANRRMVPLPEFFAPTQLAHAARDAGIGHLVATTGGEAIAAASGLPWSGLGRATPAAPAADMLGRRIIYTSGSTGAPKGVQLGRRQIEASVAALACVVKGVPEDRSLSILPFALLLEQIAGIQVPLSVGAAIRVHDGALGDMAALDAAARDATVSVLVPELLSGWTAWRRAAGGGPLSLRFLAVGGAPVSPALAAAAWAVGLPAHEGYGLSECASVVAVSAPGERAGGTVGRPLPGVGVTIESGEIVIYGPTVMDGYVGAPAVTGAWRTGDLGEWDEAGRLRVLGRRDSLIVTSTGRNISPEWIEAMLLADPRIAVAVLMGDGARPAILLGPSKAGAPWFAGAGDADIRALVEALTATAPLHARPARILVEPAAALVQRGLLTPTGRPRRKPLAAWFADAASDIPLPTVSA